MPPASRNGPRPSVPQRKSAPAATRRKRRREPWPWRGILLTLLMINVVAGVVASPALTIRRVVIEGAGEGDAPLAEAELAQLRGRPAMAAKAPAIESASLADARYETADFRRSVMGSARLRLTRRKAVAVVVEKPPLMMDASGTVYDDPDTDWKSLPRIILPVELKMTSATLGASTDFMRLAQIAVGIRGIEGERPVGIQVTGGVICLNMESARVRLGTGDRLEAKLSMLRRILAGKPGILREIKELILIAPDRPKVIPRAANPSPQVTPVPAATTSPTHPRERAPR